MRAGAGSVVVGLLALPVLSCAFLYLMRQRITLGSGRYCIFRIFGKVADLPVPKRRRDTSSQSTKSAPLHHQALGQVCIPVLTVTQFSS